MHTVGLSRKVVQAGIAFLLACSLVGVAHAEPRPVSRGYVGGWAGPGFPCDANADLGGACFYVLAGESIASFEVADDRETLPIGGWFGFRSVLPPEDPVEFHPFCGGADGIALPDLGAPTYVMQLVVVLDLYYSALACDLPGVPTTGSITVEFS